MSNQTCAEMTLQIKLLRKDKKTQGELEIMRKIIEKIPFLNSLISKLYKKKGVNQNQFIYKLMHSLKYEFMEANNVVFQQGSIEDLKFFYILEGKVSVILDKDKETTEPWPGYNPDSNTVLSMSFYKTRQSLLQNEENINNSGFNLTECDVPCDNSISKLGSKKMLKRLDSNLSVVNDESPPKISEAPAPDQNKLKLQNEKPELQPTNFFSQGISVSEKLISPKLDLTTAAVAQKRLCSINKRESTKNYRSSIFRLMQTDEEEMELNKNKEQVSVFTKYRDSNNTKVMSERMRLVKQAINEFRNSSQNIPTSSKNKESIKEQGEEFIQHSSSLQEKMMSSNSRQCNMILTRRSAESFNPNILKALEFEKRKLIVKQHKKERKLFFEKKTNIQKLLLNDKSEAGIKQFKEMFKAVLFENAYLKKRQKYNKTVKSKDRGTMIIDMDIDFDAENKKVEQKNLLDMESGIVSLGYNELLKYQPSNIDFSKLLIVQKGLLHMDNFYNKKICIKANSYQDLDYGEKYYKKDFSKKRSNSMNNLDEFIARTDLKDDAILIFRKNRYIKINFDKTYFEVKDIIQQITNDFCENSNQTNDLDEEMKNQTNKTNVSGIGDVEIKDPNEPKLIFDRRILIPAINKAEKARQINIEKLNLLFENNTKNRKELLLHRKTKWAMKILDLKKNLHIYEKNKLTQIFGRNLDNQNTNIGLSHMARFVNLNDGNIEIDNNLYAKSSKELNMRSRFSKKIEIHEQAYQKNQINPLLQKKHKNSLLEIHKIFLGEWESNEYKAQAEWHGKVIAIQAADDFFGEKAQENDQPRGASIITKTDCIFIVIARDDYNDQLERLALEEEMSKIYFLNNTLQDNTDLGDDLSLRLLNTVQEGTSKRKTLLTKEYDQGEYIYILYQGDCFLKKSFDEKVLYRILYERNNIKLTKDKASNNQQNNEGNDIAGEIIDQKEGKVQNKEKMADGDEENFDKKDKMTKKPIRKIDFDYYRPIDWKKYGMSYENLQHGGLCTEFLITRLVEGAIIGAEILFNTDGCYEFSVYPDCEEIKYFYQKKTEFLTCFPNNLRKTLKADYIMKKSHRINLFKDLTENFIYKNLKFIKSLEENCESGFIKPGETQKNLHLLRERKNLNKLEDSRDNHPSSTQIYEKTINGNFFIKPFDDAILKNIVGPPDKNINSQTGYSFIIGNKLFEYNDDNTFTNILIPEEKFENCIKPVREEHEVRYIVNQEVINFDTRDIDLRTNNLDDIDFNNDFIFEDFKAKKRRVLLKKYKDRKLAESVTQNVRDIQKSQNNKNAYEKPVKKLKKKLADTISSITTSGFKKKQQDIHMEKDSGVKIKPVNQKTCILMSDKSNEDISKDLSKDYSSVQNQQGRICVNGIKTDDFKSGLNNVKSFVNFVRADTALPKNNLKQNIRPKTERHSTRSNKKRPLSKQFDKTFLALENENNPQNSDWVFSKLIQNKLAELEKGEAGGFGGQQSILHKGRMKDHLANNLLKEKPLLNANKIKAKDTKFYLNKSWGNLMRIGSSYNKKFRVNSNGPSSQQKQQNTSHDKNTNYNTVCTLTYQRHDSYRDTSKTRFANLDHGEIQNTNSNYSNKSFFGDGQLSFGQQTERIAYAKNLTNTKKDRDKMSFLSTFKSSPGGGQVGLRSCNAVNDLQAVTSQVYNNLLIQGKVVNQNNYIYDDFKNKEATEKNQKLSKGKNNDLKFNKGTNSTKDEDDKKIETRKKVNHKLQKKTCNKGKKNLINMNFGRICKGGTEMGGFRKERSLDGSSKKNIRANPLDLNTDIIHLSLEKSLTNIDANENIFNELSKKY